MHDLQRPHSFPRRALPSRTTTRNHKLTSLWSVSQKTRRLDFVLTAHTQDRNTCERCRYDDDDDDDDDDDAVLQFFSAACTQFQNVASCLKTLHTNTRIAHKMQKQSTALKISQTAIICDPGAQNQS